jgi:hypothetical protein
MHCASDFGNVSALFTRWYALTIVRVIGKVSLNALGQLSSYKETAETSKHSNYYFFLGTFIFRSE